MTLPIGTTFKDLINVGQQGPALLNAKQVSAANAAQTLVLAGQAETRTTLRTLFLFASAAASVTVTVDTGAGVVIDLGTVALTTEAKGIDLGGALTAALGNSITVAIGAAGVGVTTTVSAVADRL